MGKRRKTSSTMQGLTNIISTTMVLVLLGIVVLTIETAKMLGDSVREKLTVTVVLQEGTSSDKAAKIQDMLKHKRYVAEIQYISAEQALSEQVESMGLDPTEFLGENPFSISMELKMKPDYSCNDSLLWITSELKGIPHVSDVVYQKELVESLNRNLTRASLILLAIALLLVVVSLVLINNTVRLSVYSHRHAIHAMKLVGARWGFIRRPFLLRAMGIGAASAFLADGILYGCIQWAATYDEAVTRYVTMQNFGIMTIALLTTGLAITVLCTYMSVTSSLKMREPY